MFGVFAALREKPGSTPALAASLPDPVPLPQGPLLSHACWDVGLGPAPAWRPDTDFWQVSLLLLIPTPSSVVISFVLGQRAPGHVSAQLSLTGIGIQALPLPQFPPSMPAGVSLQPHCSSPGALPRQALSYLLTPEGRSHILSPRAALVLGPCRALTGDCCPRDRGLSRQVASLQPGAP